MKRCPECRRDYYDDSLLFCLDDGNALLEGPANRSEPPASAGGQFDEPQTAILHETDATEAQTQAQIHTTEQTAVLPSDSGNGKKPLDKRILLAAVVLAAIGLGGFLGYRYLTASEQIGSIAVLPFENTSADPELDYLSDGVSESVIDRLSQVQGLKVIARSSSFKYRTQDPDFRQIAAELGVDAIITGRVVPRGDSCQIRVELIDARRNEHLWGQTFTRPAADIHRLQTDIAREITENLKVRLSSVQQEMFAKPGTTNPQAYELLLKGRFYFNKAGEPGNFQKAVDYFEQAIVLDPNFALAYAMLVETYSFGGITRGLTREQHELKLEAAAARALELDPDLAEAHNAMAGLKRNKWEWDEAERSYTRALELNPNLPQAHSGYALYLNLVGRNEEATRHIQSAKELDPLSLIVNTTAGAIWYRMRRFDEAIAASENAVKLGGPAMFAHRTLGSAYAAKGSYDAAVAEYQKAEAIMGGGSPVLRSLIATAHAKAGDKVRAETILKNVVDRGAARQPEIAVLYSALDRPDDAFAVLENAFRERSQSLPYIAVDPTYDALRNDPRFEDLLRRMRLPV